MYNPTRELHKFILRGIKIIVKGLYKNGYGWSKVICLVMQFIGYCGFNNKKVYEKNIIFQNK